MHYAAVTQHQTSLAGEFAAMRTALASEPAPAWVPDPVHQAILAVLDNLLAALERLILAWQQGKLPPPPIRAPRTRPPRALPSRAQATRARRRRTSRTRAARRRRAAPTPFPPRSPAPTMPAPPRAPGPRPTPAPSGTARDPPAGLRIASQKGSPTHV